MKSAEIIKNGGFQLLIYPDNAIEVAILEAMATRAEAKPELLRMIYQDGLAVVSVGEFNV